MYKFFSDPGHAWLEVEKKELETLGIASKISGYSYMKRNKAYLEEDCDAGLFIKTKGLTSKDVQDVPPIRNYESYKTQ